MRIRIFEEDFLYRQVHPASLGIFRIVFGLILFWQISKLDEYMIEVLPQSSFFLSYDYFHWVKIMSPENMALLMAGLKICAALIAIGFLYRPAVVAFFFGWTYLLLLDRGHYNNHYYLISILTGLMSFMHANRWMSVDRALNIGTARAPTIPRWQVLIVQFQVAVVYFYGAIAKLNPDWLRGYPLVMWCKFEAAAKPELAFILDAKITPIIMSYGGLLLDLTMPFLLFSRRFRLPAAIFNSFFFHLLNGVFLWNIGVFPWFMIAANSIYFDPDWPVKAQAWFRRMMGWDRKEKRKKQQGKPDIHSEPDIIGTVPGATPFRRVGRIALIAFVGWQLLMPLRSVLVSGRPAWTGVADTFSWHMMLHDRPARVKIRVALPGQGTIGYVDIYRYVNQRQFRKMTRMPKSFHRFALYLKEEMQAHDPGMPPPEIYVTLDREFNGRPYQAVLDSTVNLAGLPYPQFGTPDYILEPDLSSPPGSEWLERLTEEEALGIWEHQNSGE